MNVGLTWELAKPFSVTITGVLLVLTCFDKFLWRQLPFRWLHTLPDIGGDWEAELRSTYVDPATGLPSSIIKGNATVRQTFSTISIRLSTESMKSHLVAERLICHGDGACEIVGVFQSDPDIHLRGSQSEIHYGAFRYSIVGNPPAEMVGHYWTDRNTKGSIRLLRASRVQRE